MSSEQPPSRRAKQTVLSLNQFAHSHTNSTRRTIEKFRQKKQSNFNYKAGLLRGYRKAMTNEGYDAGHGASRKRGRNQKEEREFGKDKEEDQAADAETDGGRKRRRKKMDPFAKARVKAQEKKVEEEERKQELVAEEKQKAQRAKQRKIRAKRVSKRTRRGQPIMKDMIGDMLQKIKEKR